MNATLRAHLETWATELLGNRGDKRWEPAVFVPPHVVADLPQLAGVTVQGDPNLIDSIEIRCAADVIEDGKTVHHKGGVMARQMNAHLAAPGALPHEGRPAR